MIAVFALVPMLVLQTPAPLVDAPVEPRDEAAVPAAPGPFDDFFAEGHPGHYLQWYGAEYLTVAAVAALTFSGAFRALEPVPALIGPQVSLSDPNTAVLFDPRLTNQIGLPFLQEQVPDVALAAGLGVVLLANAGVDLAVRRDLHRTHNLVLGSAEAVFGAMLVGDGLKLGVGRLRPDFRDRYTRAACGGSIAKPEGLDCSSVPDDGFVPSRNDVLDGMKSFPSGHASTSFAALSFLTLSIGSEYLWGTEMPWWTQPVAGLAIGALTGGALYVAGTRLTDNRHHLEDILAGVGVGMATGTSAYLLHFDTKGRARRRGVAVTPVPLEGGAGVAVSGTL